MSVCVEKDRNSFIIASMLFLFEKLTEMRDSSGHAPWLPLSSRQETDGGLVVPCDALGLREGSFVLDLMKITFISLRLEYMTLKHAIYAGREEEEEDRLLLQLGGPGAGGQARGEHPA